MKEASPKLHSVNIGFQFLIGAMKGFIAGIIVGGIASFNSL